MLVCVCVCAVSYTHLDVYKRQMQTVSQLMQTPNPHLGAIYELLKQYIAAQEQAVRAASGSRDATSDINTETATRNF